MNPADVFWGGSNSPPKSGTRKWKFMLLGLSKGSEGDLNVSPEQWRELCATCKNGGRSDGGARGGLLRSMAVGRKKKKSQIEGKKKKKKKKGNQKIAL